MENTYSIANEAPVKGKYYGQEYHGIVIESRQHSIRHDLMCFLVKLDAPIKVYGDVREIIEVVCDGLTGQPPTKGWGDSSIERSPNC